ncbi:MAG: hypothetical protein HYR71_12550, partial [Chloroflexi bacterium]|nr:hypothetical protein [Chloroflexota bacterium]
MTTKRQSLPSLESEEAEKSYASLGLVVVVLLAIGAFLLVTTAPLERLLGGSAWAVIGVYHGLSAGLLL